MTPHPDIDEYGEIINGPNTYEAIAAEIGSQTRNSVVIGWTDEEGSHLDVLFALRPTQFGNLQRGYRGVTDLFVAVMGFGTAAFECGSQSHPGYYAGKLGLGDNITNTKLAELIDNIRTSKWVTG